MKSVKAFVERRKHKRFKAKGGAFAVLSSESNTIGHIKNISQGGLAFQYDARADGLLLADKLDIFLVDDRFYVKQVPVKTIRDFEIDGKMSLTAAPLRQRNIQFEEMVPIQKFQLYYILQHHTTDEA